MSEASGFAGVPVGGDSDVSDLSAVGEQLSEHVVVGLETQVAYENRGADSGAASLSALSVATFILGLVDGHSELKVPPHVLDFIIFKRALQGLFVLELDEGDPLVLALVVLQQEVQGLHFGERVEEVLDVLFGGVEVQSFHYDLEVLSSFGGRGLFFVFVVVGLSFFVVVVAAFVVVVLGVQVLVILVELEKRRRGVIHSRLRLRFPRWHRRYLLHLRRPLRPRRLLEEGPGPGLSSC